MEVMSLIQTEFNFNTQSSPAPMEGFKERLVHHQQTEFNFNAQSSPAPMKGLEERLGEKFENKLNLSVDEEIKDDFTFACVKSDKSTIPAGDIFQNGQMRPVFPIFGREYPDLFFAGDDVSSKYIRPLVKKLFVVQPSPAAAENETTVAEAAAGTFCEWSAKTVYEVSASERCKKSNSTGFSKLRRFREMVLRSNSDGKDAFVFLNDVNHSNGEKKQKGEKTKETALTAYMKSKAKESDKRKLYLPYKQVGLFTNVNGLTKNIHPF
jgi:hypothetical protein